ncbi:MULTISPECIES: hypothetical protein [Pseudomonas]|uniref:hypothetical protein n=1 Tax=Pseudomonas TaxID=286 RepID=UPI000CFD2F7D|nr:MULTISPECIES: hypothetical protein [Pseudomonas]PQZ85410.1 hypothetical protein CQ048_23525 [Pseudomonas trivialis]PRB21338.1 hypothetical protein CQ041_23840 [Pseudomonas sp. MYb60]
MIREIENALMAAFDQTMCKYRQILNNYYPAHKSTGFTERNLTNNFVRALENELGKDAFAWFEAPLSAEEKLHLDAIVFDPTTKSCFLIEAKRFSNLNKKVAETTHDIQRMSYQAHHATLELGLGKLKIEHRYAIVLVDIWTEGEAKQVTFENWPACLGNASFDLFRTGGFENLMIEKEWKHHYKIMMAAKKL